MTPDQMTPDQWSLATRLFHTAAELPLAERTPYLAAESGGDIQVQQAVERLLLADSASGDSYLEQPAAAEPQFHDLFGIADADPPEDRPLLCADQVLADRFRIVRLLGAGGMGQVYQAFDLDLQVPVALKLIRPEIAAEPDTIARFRQEVRLARTITHRNVCRTYDLERAQLPGTAQELLFLTMEYVEGETLAALLAREGPLAPASALAIASQIAAGIDAAHALSVAHLDLKPANVLLTPAPSRVVITDFGLARLEPVLNPAPLHGSSASSRSSRVLAPAGTMAYMAPEQIGGAKPGPAADLYAFGLILYELVTGRKAFPVESFFPDLAGRLNGNAPAPAALVPSLPPAWNTVVARCLELRPADRFPTATAAVGALERARPRQTRRSPARPKERRLLPAILVLLALAATVALVFGILRLTRQASIPAQVSSGSLLYLPAVRNLTSNPNLAQVSSMLRTSLDQSAHITLLDDSRAAETLERMVRTPGAALDDPTLREVAMRNGASRVVLATLAPADSLLRLTIDIQQPDSAPERYRHHWTRSWTCCQATPVSTTAIPADLLHIVRDASDWVRQVSGEDVEDIALLNAPVEDLTTIDWRSLAEYAKAERLQLAGRTDDAIQALANALQFDPAFALAYSRRGDLLCSLGRTEECMADYRRALDAGNQRRLTRRERDRLRGLYALDTWDYATAEQIFRDSTVYYDHDYLSWFFRGSALQMLNRLPEAADALRHANQLAPTRPSAPFALASTLLLAGDLPAANTAAHALAATGEHVGQLWLQAEEAFLAGDPTQADALLARVTDSGPSILRSLAFRARATLAANRNDLAFAIRLVDQGIEIDRSTGQSHEAARKRMLRAALECTQHAYTPCLADERAALADDRSPRNLRDAGEILSTTLSSLPATPLPALRQELAHVGQLASDAPDSTASQIVRAELTGDLALAHGDTATAEKQFRLSAVQDAPAEAPLRLHRALSRLLPRERDPRRRQQLRAELARPTLASAQTRALLWYRVDDFLPTRDTPQP